MPFFGAKAKIRTQIDTKALASLRKLNLSAQNCSLTVGFHDDAGTYENAPDTNGREVSVAEVALWQEYGTKYIPARPFFYPALEGAKKGVEKLQASVMAHLLSGKENLLHGLSRIGFYVQNSIQSKLKMGEFEPLSDAYLAWRKEEYPGSGDRPLIRSGLLLRSVRFKASVDGKKQESPKSAEAPLLPSKQAIAEANADKKRRAAQRAAARKDPEGTQKAFDKQGRAFAPRKPPVGH